MSVGVEYDVPMQHILDIVKEKPVLGLGAAVVVLVLVGAAAGIFFRGGNEYVEIPVVVKDIQTTVVFSGAVTPASRVSLAFERSARVSSIPVSVGERVVQGETLIRLDGRTTAALLEEARAQVAVEQAALETLLEGTREEQVAVVEEELRSQMEAVLDAEVELERAVDDAFSDIDTAVYTYTDRMFDSPQSSNPELSFSAIDSTRENAVNSLRRSLGLRIEAARTITLSAEDMEALLDDVAFYLGELSFLLTNRIPSALPSDSTVSTWQANIATARGNIETAQTALLGKEVALRAARAKESVISRELALLRSGSTATSIREQEARLRSREATVSRYASELAQYTLVSPISGVVSDIAIELGELAQVNVSVVEILSEGTFDIEADISELDLPFLSVGDEAVITFDAYSDDFAIPATIVSIDPGEQIINGVPAYGVTLRIDSTDPRIRSGLTANAVVEIIEREGVRTLPREAVDITNGTGTVLQRVQGEVVEKAVEVGIRGRDGTVEIISGLEEGDIVLIP